jgi:hypothetical protein
MPLTTWSSPKELCVKSRFLATWIMIMYDLLLGNLTHGTCLSIWLISLEIIVLFSFLVNDWKLYFLWHRFLPYEKLSCLHGETYSGMCTLYQSWWILIFKISSKRKNSQKNTTRYWIDELLACFIS